MKSISYKGHILTITAQQRYKDGKLKIVYLGHFSYYKSKQFYTREKTIESIHCDKVISKFEKFVDEYCTDWRTYTSIPYKGYKLWVKQEHNGENFFGICKIHKNSTFKYITNCIIELEAKFRSRIDKIIECKGKAVMTPISSKEEKIKKLESEIAKLQKELESIKKRKSYL